MSDIVKRREELELNDTVKKNSKGEAILGQLTGPCADFILPTRNGRGYSEDLWEKVFDSEIINEYFEAGGILGELNHPADRSETDLEKVAVCMPQKPSKDNDGHLVATFDILDTPNGRIVYTLAKYGYKLGVSSRGDGETYDDIEGNEQVDADTYQLQAFDIVLLPAVKAARLKMVESVQKSFNQALTESLNKSTPEERKIMEDTLRGLKIDYKPEKVDNINEVNQNKNDTADDVGVDVIKDLQESLQRELALKEEIKKLQEKLSVCYTKDKKKDEQLSRYKSSVITLSNSAKQVKKLTEQVETLTKQLEIRENTILAQTRKIKTLSESQQSNRTHTQTLNESLTQKDTKIKELSQQNRVLKESLKTANAEAESQKVSLTEQIENLKTNSAIKNKEFTTKIAKANKLTEQYRQVAKVAVNKYIESKALMIGVSPEEITNRLSENYSFDEIDKVCEGLQEYQISISKLPFNVAKKSVRMSITESKNEPLKPNTNGVFDDEVDDQLIRLANNI